MSDGKRESFGDWAADRALTRRAFVSGLCGAGFAIAAGRLSAAPGRSTGSSHDDADRVSAEVATGAWFDLSLDLVRSAAGFSPPVASRAFAYTGLALYGPCSRGWPGTAHSGESSPT